jgi:hypothetical protein
MRALSANMAAPQEKAPMSTLMSALAHPYLLGAGAILLAAGYWLRSWASRHNLLDMAKDAAKDAAWQVAKNKGNLAAVSQTDMARKLKDLHGDTSNTGRAKTAAGYAARHAAATVAGWTGLISLLAGAAMIAAAFLLK